jgi:lycopene cyclase domain-containing protein
MSLYLSILVFSAVFPFLLSFDKRVRFYRKWKALFPSMIIAGSIYLAADVIFARQGIWGFNPSYHSGILLLGLPLEEWLFFIVVPYASVFIHYVVVHYFPKLVTGNRFIRIFSTVLILILLTVVVLNYEKAYTIFNFSLLIVVLIVALFDKSGLLNRYIFSFLFILIPFFIVNGLLTGTFTPGEVVWYNDRAILGIRILTIPVEDIGYAFSLILMNLLIINKFQKLSYFRE